MCEAENNMKRLSLAVAALLMGWVCLADESGPTGEKEFVRSVIQSLITNNEAITFEVADRVVAIDNGEVLSREELKKAWPELAKRAFKKSVSIDDFFAAVDLHVRPVADEKRVMSNKKLLDAYKPQPGDMYCDASHVKEGVDNFIGYDKAFIFIIRKVAGKWVLIGIGG